MPNIHTYIILLWTVFQRDDLNTDYRASRHVFIRTYIKVYESIQTLIEFFSEYIIHILRNFFKFHQHCNETQLLLL